MHHRKPNTNFAQYVMFWDRLMGTFRPYDAGQWQTTKSEAATAAAEADRLPAWADSSAEAVSGRIVERGTGGQPAATAFPS